MFIDNKLFCNHYFSSKNAMNIIVTHTPLGSTTLMQPAYEPLTKYNVNIFGIDFSGTGQSKGADFSLETIIADMNAVVDYIAENYSDNIHIFGNTGIGGIFAQYAVNSGVDKKIKSFAQFACAVHKDTSALGKPLWLVKMLVPILKTFPNTKMTFKVPKFSGFNADKDNAFYEELEKLVPNSMQCKLSLLSTLLESIVANESVLQNDIACPTLVFKVLHDRYFPPQYFDKYYSALKCEKKLVEINDAHNSYYYNSDLFCEEAYNWFISRCKVPK